MWVPFSGRYSISGMEGFAGSRDPKPHLVMQIPQGKASNFQALLLIRASICTHPLRKGLPHGTRNGWWQFLPWLLHGFQGRQHLQELWDSQLLLNVCEDLVVYPIILQGMQKRLQGVGPLVFEHILERCKAMLSPNPRSRGRCLRQAPPGQEFFSLNKRGNLGWHRVKHWYWYGSNSTSNSRVRNAQMLLQFGTNHPNMGATDLTILTHPRSS